MNPDSFIPWMVAAFALLISFWMHMAERRFRYYDRRISALTRRIWILEGSPRDLPEDVQ